MNSGRTSRASVVKRRIVNEFRTHEPCVPTGRVEARRMGLLTVDCCQLSFNYQRDYTDYTDFWHPLTAKRSPLPINRERAPSGLYFSLWKVLARRREGC